MAQATKAATAPAVVSAKTQMLLNDAWLEMLEHRKTGGSSRAIKRGWKYGEGKQVALKAGVGIAVGVVFTGVSIATAGAALPVVIAVAAGGFAAGQAANASFSILKNRGSMRGLGSTANWIDSIRGKAMQEQQEHTKALDTRAYKTIRRAYEHFREAGRKATEAEAFRVALKKADITLVPCDDMLALLTASMSVSHHLHKARLYIEPAIHVERVLLFALHAWIREWRDADTKLATLVDQFVNQHKEACGKGCYFESAGATGHGRSEEVDLWADTRIDRYDKKLAHLFDELAVASVAPAPPASVPAAALPRIRRMVDDTYTYWKLVRKAPDVRIRHFISNTFARKTKAERVAFGVGQAVGTVATIASTAGGQAVDASVKALMDAGYAGLDLGLAFGSTAADAARDFGGGLAIDKFADKVAPAPEVSAQTDLGHHPGSTAAATENREFLRKAAQHIYEADERKKRVDELGTLTITSCAHARELAAHAYAVNHHLGKAQTYLEQAIELTIRVGKPIRDESRNWTKKFNEVYAYCSKRVAVADHTLCFESEACYGPSGGPSSGPVRPITAGW